jgi:hypothetical protein
MTRFITIQQCSVPRVQAARRARTAARWHADAYFGLASAIIQQREKIKRQTIQHLRLQHSKLAA